MEENIKFFIVMVEIFIFSRIDMRRENVYLNNRQFINNKCCLIYRFFAN